MSQSPPTGEYPPPPPPTSPPPPTTPAPGPDQGEERRPTALIVVLVVLLVLLAGVVGYLVAQILADEDDEPAPTTTAAGAVPAPGTPGTGSLAGPESSAPCTGDAILTGLGGSVQGTPVTVTDFACTSATPGYAWATVVPADPTVVADPLTVYLAAVGGVWEARDFGTGISCSGSGLPAEACAELP